MEIKENNAVQDVDVRKCLVCQSGEYTVLRDRLRYDVRRDVTECLECGFVYLWPRIGKQETVEFYKKDHYRNIPREKLGLQTHSSDGTFHSRMGQAQHRFNIVAPYLSKEKSLLEVGCGSGSFLSLVQPLVKECKAMELDTAFAQYVRDRFKVDVYEDAIQDLSPDMGKFDVISMWFVLEHLHDPVVDLKKLREFISDSGVLLMLLPNLNDPLLTVYHSLAYENFFYQLPHLNYFSPQTLCKALDQSGWTAEIRSVQIYGLLNHLRWVLFKKPQAKQSKGIVNFFNIFDKVYRKVLEKNQQTDSLLVIARKA